MHISAAYTVTAKSDLILKGNRKMQRKLIPLILMAAVLTACSDSTSDNGAADTDPETAPAAETIQEVTAMTYEIDPTKPLVALTFDDGPNTSTTVQVLNILEKYQVPASFFLIGDNITPEAEEVVKRAYDMGCEIDNHSKTHSYMNSMDPEDIRSEVQFVSDKVQEITGEPTKFFRPPYIAVNADMYDNIDMPFICGAGCNDWDKKVTVRERVEKTIEQTSDGSIILLHDAAGNDQTVEAIDQIIPQLLEQGYQFVTVSELFETKGVPIDPEDTNLYTVVG